MNPTQLRQQERSELLATLRSLGPDVPTLCSRWTASDVAGHIVVAESGLGLPMVVGNQLRRVLPAPVTRQGIESLQSVGDRMIARAKRRGWEPLLGRLAAGPPRSFWHGSLADLRLVEEWIHHEDIRRPNGFGPRSGSDALDGALWNAGLTITRFPEFLPGREGLAISTPDGRHHELSGNRSVHVNGRPGELLLYLAGRGGAAEVTVGGDEEAIRALQGRLAV